MNLAHSRSNYRNYNRRNIIDRHYQQQQCKIRKPQSSIRQIQEKNRRRKPNGRIGIKVRLTYMKVYMAIPRIGQKSVTHYIPKDLYNTSYIASLNEETIRIRFRIMHQQIHIDMVMEK